MAKVKEFRVTVADQPGALAAICLALGERGINILAFESFVEQSESLARFVVDDPNGALEVLRGLRTNFEQDDAAMVALPHVPGALGKAAAKLGEARININYSYCGLQPGSTRPLAVFGVDQATRAGALLEELAAKLEAE
jgi:hypothetical protein